MSSHEQRWKSKNCSGNLYHCVATFSLQCWKPGQPFPVFQYILVKLIMETDKSWKKNCKRSSLSLYRQSGKCHEQNPIPSKVVHTKHVDTTHHDYYGHDHVSKTTAMYTMHTTSGVQTTCSMSKMSIASVQTRTLGTRSLYCQTEKTTRKSVSTQCTK